MNAFDVMERRHRTLLVCHAIRYLLDQPQDRVTTADVDAVDILQAAISTEPACESADKVAGQSEGAKIPTLVITGGSVPERATAELDNNNDVVSRIAFQRATLKRLMHDSPTPLVSILERLLKAVDDKALQNAAPAKHEALEYIL